MPRRARVEALRPVAGALGELGREHQVAMGVLDVDHAPGADDADLEPVHGPGQITGSAQLMFMLQMAPLLMVKMPQVASFVPCPPSTLSEEAA